MFFKNFSSTKINRTKSNVAFALKPLVIVMASALTLSASESHALTVTPTNKDVFENGSHQFDNDMVEDDLRISGNYDESQASFVIQTGGTLEFKPAEKSKDRVLFVTNNSGFLDRNPITQLTVEGGIKIDSFVSKKTQTGIMFGTDSYKTFAVIQAGSEFKSKYDNTSGKIFVEGDVTINRVSSEASSGKYNGSAVYVGEESVFNLTKNDGSVGNLTISNSAFNLEVIDLGGSKYNSNSMGPTFVVNDIRITSTDAAKALTVFGGDVTTGDIYIAGGSFSSGLIDISGRGQKDGVRTRVDIGDITVEGTTIKSGPALYVGTSGGQESETGTVEASIGNISIIDVTAKLADQTGFIEFNQNQNTDIVVGDIAFSNVTLAKNVGSKGISGVRFRSNQSVTVTGTGRLVFENVAINRVEESTSTTYWSDKMSLLWLDHAVDGIHEVSVTNLTNDYARQGTNPNDKSPYLTAIQLNFEGEQDIGAIVIDTVATHEEGIAKGIYQSDDGNHLKSESIYVKNVSGESDAYGLHLLGELTTASGLSVENITGSTNDGQSYGVFAGGNLTLGTQSSISTVKGFDAFGLYAEFSSSASGTFSVASVFGTASSTGAYFEGSKNNFGSIRLDEISSDGADSQSVGLHVKEGDIKRETILTADQVWVSNIKAAGTAYGILGDGGKSDIEAETVVVTDVAADDLAVGLAAHEADIGSLSVARIEGANSAAILALEKGKDGILINSSGEGIVQVRGNVVVHDAGGRDQAALNMQLTDEFSYFEGAAGFTSSSNAKLEDRISESSELKLTLKKGAQWKVTDDSYVTSLTVADNGAVDLSYGGTTGSARSETWRKVEANALAADGGRFVFGLNLAAESAENVALDQLVIHKAAQGSAVAEIRLEAEGIAADKEHSVNWLVSQGDESRLTLTNANGENAFSGAGMASVWSLGFVADGNESALDSTEGMNSLTNYGEGAGDWYLIRTEAGTGEIDPDAPTTPSEIRDNLTIGTSAAQALAYLADLEDLRKRLGEVRYGAQAGAWAKAFARQERVGIRSNFRQEVYGVNVGFDALAAASESSSWLAGGAFRYSKADQEGLALDGASGDLEEYSVKAYATWMHEKGSYADFVLQAGRYEQEIDGLDNTGTGKSHADYGTWGFGASVEVGRMFAFGEGADDRRWFNHWFVEPQLELSYFRAKGADYSTSTGLRVSQESAQFLTGRAGLVLGKKFGFGTADDLDRRYAQFALTAGVKHEFLGGEQTIRYAGVDGVRRKAEAEDISGTRFYYGLSADWQLAGDWRIYGQISRESGDSYTKDYDVSVGVKRSFF